MCISPESFWGCKCNKQNMNTKHSQKSLPISACYFPLFLFFFPGMNYFTSALPFLSAAQQGFLGENIQVFWGWGFVTIKDAT